MWPYTDDEAGWLTPPPRASGAANDNDPDRRVPPRGSPDTSPPARKPARET